MDLESASDLDSDSESDYESDSEADLEPPHSLNLLPSEPSFRTSIPCLKQPCLKHSVRTRIQAVSFLELNILHFTITTKTGISKAQIYKLRDKAILQD
jgi:hypothetical protein